MKKLKGQIRLLSVFALGIFLLTGCGDLKTEGKTEKVEDWKASSQNQVGNLAYRKVETLGQYRFDPEDKSICNTAKEIGIWAQTDHKIMGEESPNKWRFSVSAPEDVYEIGESVNIRPYIAISKDDKENCEDIWGAVYFADPKGEDVTLDSELTVCEYFIEDVNTGTYPIVEMSHFARDNDGRSGGTDWDSKKEEEYNYFFDCVSNMPRLGAAGDKVYIVLDIHGSSNEMLRREMWEYAYETVEQDPEDSDDSAKEEAYYEKREASGRWDLSNIFFIGGDGESVEKDGLTITADRYGIEGEDIVYTFEGKDGSYHRIRIPDMDPRKSYYVDDWEIFFNNVYSYREPANAPGLLECSVSFADVEFGDGKYGIKVEPRQYLRDGDEPVSSFTVPVDPNDSDAVFMFKGEDRGTDIDMETNFPLGRETGEKIYLCFCVKDGFSGDVRAYNIYEYTYTEGPVYWWYYNPPGV